MSNTRHTLNELLVGLFNYILYIEERNLKKSGVELSMNDVHILENIEKASDNSMSHIAGRLMVTQGTLTTNVAKLINKGYVIRYKDENDKRIVRLKITEKAQEILKIHDDFHANMIDKAIGDLGLDENEVLNESLENILAYFREEYAEQHRI
ncbi:MAG: MarR family transcriptional regulator [Erysipelotrichia bacterium]|nr:MarR family transcriptional regulator [Erysipelotrichia bacterium]NCC54710.1 MarR family transcriptional regulator [Erysipelotrichia bacterium]